MIANLCQWLTQNAVNLLVQSTVLIVIGLLVARIARRYGSAVQSAIYRGTLAAVLLCPFAALVISSLGISGWTIEVPGVMRTVMLVQESPAIEAVARPEPREPGPQVPMPPLHANRSLAESVFPDDLPVESRHDVARSSPMPAVDSIDPDTRRTIDPSRPPVPLVEQLVPNAPLAFLYFAALLTCILGSIVMLVRLAAAYGKLHRLRGQSIPAGEVDRALCQELASRMSVPAPEVLRNSLLSSPCLTGVVDPAILLPEEITRRVPLEKALAHELAHLRRRDIAWNLIQRISLALFWYQPLLWRLVYRLETTAEEVCDDVVIKYCVDRRGYARQLVALAESNLLPPNMAGLGMFSSRSILGRRVQRILDTTRQLTTHLSAAVVAAVVTLSVLLAAAGGMIGTGTPRQAAAANTEASETTEAAQRDDQILITDTSGRPISKVPYVIFGQPRSPAPGLSQAVVLSTGVSDENGHAIIDADKLGSSDFYWVCIIARREKFGLGWLHLNADQKPVAESIILRPEQSMRARLVSLEGDPVKQVPVHIDQIGWQGAEFDQRVIRLDCDLPATIWPAGITTDNDGWFAIPGLPAADCSVLIRIDSEPFARSWFFIDPESEDAPAPTFAVSPAQVVTGTVAAGEGDQPVPNARVVVTTLSDPEAGISGMLSVEGYTDDQGRFRINPYSSPKGYTVVAHPAAETPYLPTEVAVDWPAGRFEVDTQVDLIRGVLVRGNVINQHGDPIAGASIQYAERTNNPLRPANLISGWRGIVSSDEKGQYAIAVLPGEGHLLVHGPGRHFVRTAANSRYIELGTDQPGTPYILNRAVEIEVASGDTPTVDIQLEKGFSTKVALDNVTDRPLTMVWHGLTSPYRYWQPHLMDEVSFPMEFAGLSKAQTEYAYIIDEKEKRGIRVALGGDQYTDSKTVELQRCGTATIRFVDEQKRPLPGIGMVLELVNSEPLDPILHPLVNVHVGHLGQDEESERGSNANGESTFQCLIPGATYHLVSLDGRSIDRSFTITSPGEHLDLGERTVTDPFWLERSRRRAEELQDSSGNGNQNGSTAVSQDETTEDPALNESRKVSGAVVDEDGRLLAGVKVVAMTVGFDDGSQRPTLSTTTDDQGRFEFDLNKGDFDQAGEDWWKSITIAAFDHEHGPDWFRLREVEKISNLRLKLVGLETPPFGRLVDSEGQPVVGASITVASIAKPLGEARDGGMPVTLLELPLETDEDSLRRFQFTTDMEGKYTLTSVGNRQIVAFSVKAPGLAHELIQWHHKMAESNPDGIATHVISPSRLFEGIVKDSVTGEPVPGALIRSHVLGGRGSTASTTITARSDDQGKFVLAGIPSGDRNTVVVFPPKDLPYFVREVELPNPPGSGPVPLDIELSRGVWVSGSIVDKATGAGVVAKVTYQPSSENAGGADIQYLRGDPSLLRLPNQSDHSGSFRIVGLPGHGFLVIDPQRTYPMQLDRNGRSMDTHPFFMTPSGVKARLTGTVLAFDINLDSSREATIDTIELDPGREIPLQLVGPDEELVGDVSVLRLNSPAEHWRDIAGTDIRAGGFMPGEVRGMMILHPEKRLGAAIELSAESHGDGPLKVNLAPCATIIGQIVDDAGQPIRRAQIHFSRQMPGQRFRTMMYDWETTDEEGRFVFDRVIPNARYRVSYDKGRDNAELSGSLDVSPGERIDLGTIDITTEERPEPKRTRPITVQDGGDGTGERPTLNQSTPGADSLVPRNTIRGQVVDLEGQPVVRATVSILGEVKVFEPTVVDGFLETLKAKWWVSEFDELPTIASVEPEHADFETAVQTDSDGRFALTGVPRDAYVVLQLEDPSVVTTLLPVFNRTMPPLDCFMVTDDHPMTVFGDDVRFIAQPCRPIVGTVTDAATGEPIGDALVVAHYTTGAPSTVVRGALYPRARSNLRGEYRITGVAKSEDTMLSVYSPDDAPYLFKIIESVPDTNALEPAQVNIQLHQGVWIEGRVTNSLTGHGVRAWMDYAPLTENLAAKELKFRSFYGALDPNVFGTFTSDEQGYFRFAGVPGPAVLGATGMNATFQSSIGYQELLRAVGKTNPETGRPFIDTVLSNNPNKHFANSMVLIDPPDEATRFHKDLQLDPGRNVTVNILDSEGKRMNSTMVINANYPPVVWVDGQIDLLAMGPDEVRTIRFMNKEHQLGKVVALSADTATNGQIDVVLEPLGAIKGRLVHASGDPVDSVRSLTFDGTFSATTSYYKPKGVRAAYGWPDEEGDFVLCELPTPFLYTLNLVKERFGPEVFVELDKPLQAGTTLDLGEINVDELFSEDPSAPDVLTTRTVQGTPPLQRWKKDDEFVFLSMVVDEDHQPIAGVPVSLAVWPRKWHPENMAKVVARTHSGDDGTFVLRISEAELAEYDLSENGDTDAAIFARTDGLCADSVMWKDLPEYGTGSFYLIPENTIRGKLVDLEGTPVAGAKVTIMRGDIIRSELTDRWLRALKQDVPWPDAKPRDNLRRTLAPRSGALDATTYTDASGQFELRGIPPDTHLDLRIDGPSIASQLVTLVNRSIEPVEFLPNAASNYRMTLHGDQPVIVAQPSRPITGTVTDAKTGKPIAGARVYCSHNGSRPTLPGTFVAPEAFSDENGKFELRGLAVSTVVTLAVYPPSGEPYLIREIDEVAVPNIDDSEPLDIQLYPGTWITGKVVDRSTGEGVPNAKVHFIPLRDNPAVQEVRKVQYPYRQDICFFFEHYRTKADGSFKIAGLPGPAVLGASGNSFWDYRKGVGYEQLLNAVGKPYSAVQIEQAREMGEDYSDKKYVDTWRRLEVNEISPDVMIHIDTQPGEMTEHCLELDPGRELELLVVDDQGKPVDEVTVTRVDGLRSESFTGGRVTLTKMGHDEQRRISLVNRQWGLGAFAVVSGDRSPEDELRIQLNPCGTIRGRLVDAEGKPIAGAKVNPNAGLATTTYESGEFVLHNLITPLSYRLEITKPDTMSHKLYLTNRELEPGQTLDLGDINVDALTMEYISGL